MLAVAEESDSVDVEWWVVSGRAVKVAPFMALVNRRFWSFAYPLYASPYTSEWDVHFFEYSIEARFYWRKSSEVHLTPKHKPCLNGAQDASLLVQSTGYYPCIIWLQVFRSIGTQSSGSHEEANRSSSTSIYRNV